MLMDVLWMLIPSTPLLTAAGICVMMETYIEAWQLFMHDARGRLFNMHMHRAALFDLTLHYQRALYIQYIKIIKYVFEGQYGLLGVRIGNHICCGWKILHMI